MIDDMPHTPFIACHLHESFDANCSFCVLSNNQPKEVSEPCAQPQGAAVDAPVAQTPKASDSLPSTAPSTGASNAAQFVPSERAADTCCYCGHPIMFFVEKGQHPDGRVFHAICYDSRLGVASQLAALTAENALLKAVSEQRTNEANLAVATTRMVTAENAKLTQERNDEHIRAKVAHADFMALHETLLEVRHELEYVWKPCAEMNAQYAKAFKDQVSKLTRERDEAKKEHRRVFTEFEGRASKMRDQLRAERDGWEESTRFHLNNEMFYRGIVSQIGEMFGVAAKTSDDGSVQQDVLALKVPELVATLHAAMAVKDAAIKQLDAIYRSGLDEQPECPQWLATALSTTPANDLLARIEDAAKAILEAMNDICSFNSSAFHWQDLEVPQLLTPSPNWIHTHHKLKGALAGLQPWRPKA